jgi:2-hydroxy-3-keto-5-methylthiopentenyl-1-phosphate phosphatase
LLMDMRDKQPTRDRGASKVLILCDFDGTVSSKDTVNRLIREHIASPEWRFHVKQYLRGEVGSREVYEAVAPLMHMTPKDLEDFVLQHAELDPGFPQFLTWAGKHGIDVKIVSDGFDATIRTLLRNHGIEGMDIFSNCLSLSGHGPVNIDSPHGNPQCGRCAACKVQVLQAFRPAYDTIVLIGDGESDRHAARQADAVIALKDLFVYCAREGIPAVRADGFHEIPFLLTRRVDAVAFDMDGTLVDSIESIVEAFNHLFARLGYPSMTVGEVVRHTGVSLLDFVKGFLKPDEVQGGIKIFRDYYDTIFLERTKLMPGARAMLDALDGTVVQGVVTNKRGPYARCLAEHLGIAEKMVRIIGAEDGFKAKPAADMFEEFMRSAGSTPDRTVYVGDAPIDVQAAANAGIDAFVVANDMFSGEELALLKPRRVLTGLNDLPVALQPIILLDA